MVIAPMMHKAASAAKTMLDSFVKIVRRSTAEFSDLLFFAFRESPYRASGHETRRTQQRHLASAPYFAATSISFFASALGAPLVARARTCLTSVPGMTATAPVIVAALP